MALSLASWRPGRACQSTSVPPSWHSYTRPQGPRIRPIIEPSNPFVDGERDERGRFAKGNRLGHGNPHAAQVARLRSALPTAVTEEDMRQVIARLVQLAKECDVRAVKELLDRTLGKPQEANLIERIEQLEELLQDRMGVR